MNVFSNLGKHKMTDTDLTGSNGLGSGCGRLLNCLMISLIDEVGSDLGVVSGLGVGFLGGSGTFFGGLRECFTVGEKK